MRSLLPLSAVLFAISAHAIGPTGFLNDTGQAICYDGSTMVACTTTNAGDAAAFPRQDGRFGRDRAGMAKTGGGAAGFDFSRICMNGDAAGSGTCPVNPVANAGAGPAATEWACTRDNVTNLVWSLQTVSNIDWVNNSISVAVGQPIALANGGSRCGFSAGWRVPTLSELQSIVHYGASNPAIDRAYFPGTLSDSYLSNDASANDVTYAWTVSFYTGRTSVSKTNFGHVRLVRSGQ